MKRKAIILLKRIGAKLRLYKPTLYERYYGYE